MRLANSRVESAVPRKRRVRRPCRREVVYCSISDGFLGAGVSRAATASRRTLFCHSRFAGTIFSATSFERAVMGEVPNVFDGSRTPTLLLETTIRYSPG